MTVQNYVTAWNDMGFSGYFGNSVLNSGVSVLFVVIMQSW